MLALALLAAEELVPCLWPLHPCARLEPLHGEKVQGELGRRGAAPLGLLWSSGASELLRVVAAGGGPFSSLAQQILTVVLSAQLGGSSVHLNWHVCVLVTLKG